MASRSLSRRQVSVHKCDRHCSLAYRRGAPFHRTVPHITGSKYAGYIRLEVVWLPIEPPAWRHAVVGREVGAGYETSRLIAHNPDFFGPAGPRIAADADKQPARQ